MVNYKYDVISEDCEGLNIPEAKKGKLKVTFDCFLTATEYLDNIAWNNAETFLEYLDAISMDYTIKIKGKKVRLNHEDYKKHIR